MKLFSSRELADLRAMDVSAMLDSVTIITITQTADAGGAVLETTSTATTIGRLRVRGGGERYTDQQREKGNYEVALPRDTQISGTSRVIVNDQEYRVVFCPVLTELDTARLVGLTEK